MSFLSTISDSKNKIKVLFVGFNLLCLFGFIYTIVYSMVFFEPTIVYTIMLLAWIYNLIVVIFFSEHKLLFNIFKFLIVLTLIYSIVWKVAIVLIYGPVHFSGVYIVIISGFLELLFLLFTVTIVFKLPRIEGGTKIDKKFLICVFVPLIVWYTGIVISRYIIKFIYLVR